MQVPRGNKPLKAVSWLPPTHHALFLLRDLEDPPGPAMQSYDVRQSHQTYPGVTQGQDSLRKVNSALCLCPACHFHVEGLQQLQHLFTG